MKNNITRIIIVTLGFLGFIVAACARRYVRESEAEQAQMRAELEERVQDEEFQQQLGKISVDQTLLSIQETEWSEQGSSTYDPMVFTSLQKGDVVYDDHFVKIKVKSVNESRIVLVVEGGMVEPNDDGTIDLGAEPIEKLELDCGQSIELVSTSMSAGFNLVIAYEQNQNVIVH
jgi:hypothetical protein